jgi:hypothetical protein
MEINAAVAAGFQVRKDATGATAIAYHTSGAALAGLAAAHH